VATIFLGEVRKISQVVSLLVANLTIFFSSGQSVSGQFVGGQCVGGQLYAHRLS